MRQSQKENEDINERYQGNSSDESVYKQEIEEIKQRIYDEISKSYQEQIDAYEEDFISQVHLLKS